MTFEEFFKKKKINLETLQQGDAGLFAEFKEHFEAMGEKSFDHTKKYWFNKLRHVYPLPPEVKVEKLHMENRLAEQTIIDTLTEPATADSKAAETIPAPEDTGKAAAPAGFKPRFKPGMAKPSVPAEPKEETVQPAAENQPSLPTENKQETSADVPKIGFKPRFKAGATKPADPASEEKAEEKSIEQTPAQPEQASAAATEAPKPGFKPRFKPGITKPASTPTEEQPEEKTVEQPSAQPEQASEPATEAPKLGFKPRFKAGVTKPATDEKPTVQHEEALTGNKDPAVPPADQIPTEPIQTAIVEPQKLGFKPRFKAGVTAKAKEAEELGNEPGSATATPDVNAAIEQQEAIREKQPLADMQQQKPAFEKEKEQVQKQYGSSERENKHLSPEEGIADLENKEPED